MKTRTFVAFKLTLTALCGIAGLASNPDFYTYAPISVLVCVAGYFAMRDPMDRRLLIGAFVAIGLVAFAAGRLCFQNHRLNGDGIFIMFVFCLVPAVVVALSIYSNESELAKVDRPLA
jgi:hypothetical protein